MTPPADTFMDRIHAIDEQMQKLLASLREPPAIERRAPPQPRPRITKQEAYEAAISYLEEEGQVYTATLVKDSLVRCDRRQHARTLETDIKEDR